jgi:nicotinamidase-related amidase
MNTALVLVDIQNDYFPGGAYELEGPVEAGNMASRLLAATRKAALPVIHVRHVNLRPGTNYFLAGTPGVEIHNCVAPLPGETIIVKHHANSFRETELNAILRKNDVHRLIICGMMSHMCVHAIVRAAYDLGYECLIAHDACTTKSLAFNNIKVSALDVHSAFMAALNGLYAQVKTTDEIIAAIERKTV